MSFTVLIPARLASTRLPNKPLADIGGLPMVVRVAQRVLLGQPPCKCPFSGLVARDLVGHGLGAFVFEQGLPLGVGFGNFVGHGA